MRGEYRYSRLSRLGIFGSSPHAWGILLYLSPVSACLRFIPTCVGNTYDSVFILCEISVHPHMRGEYDCWFKEISVLTRFIPTCVGNTCRLSHRCRRYSVHPHMRGEYGISLCLSCCSDGSSPHAWGILSLSIRALIQQRFIPTCVGNTSGFRTPPNESPGSSPHAWGIQRLSVLYICQNRFIPTCVGNTLYEKIINQDFAVHPHMRGEY